MAVQIEVLGGSLFPVALFGAVGDGIADDAAAIQAAIDAAAVNGGVVRLDAKTYLCGTRLVVHTDNVTIEGAGTRATRLTFTEGAAGGIHINGVRYCRLKSMTVEGPSDLKISGSTVANGVTYTIADNSGGADFTASGAPDNNVGTTFAANGTAPTWGTGALFERPSGDGVLLEDVVECSFEDLFVTGWYGYDPENVWFPVSFGLRMLGGSSSWVNHFSRCTFAGNSAGVRIAGQAANLISIRAQGNFRVGLHEQGYAAVCTGCVFEGNGRTETGTPGYGVRVDSNYSHTYTGCYYEANKTADFLAVGTRGVVVSGGRARAGIGQTSFAIGTTHPVVGLTIAGVSFYGDYPQAAIDLVDVEGATVVGNNFREQETLPEIRVDSVTGECQIQSQMHDVGTFRMTDQVEDKTFNWDIGNYDFHGWVKVYDDGQEVFVPTWKRM